MSKDEPTQAEKIEKLDTLLRDIQTAMFTTVDDDTGQLFSRPMALQGGLDSGHLYFFSYDDTGKTADLRRDRQVNCGFSSPGDQKYVSVAGTANVTRDRAKMEEKWDSTMKAWFPDGLDTDGICLIDVTVEDAQYWNAPNNVLIHAYGMVKAALTGEGVKDAGENEKVSL